MSEHETRDGDAGRNGAEPHVIEVSFARHEDAVHFRDIVEDLLHWSGEKGTIALCCYPESRDAALREAGRRDLFVDGEFTAHSGDILPFKIDCDALTDADLTTLAAEIARRVVRFQSVHGIPRGGLRLAAALDRYATHSPLDPTLIVDDVLTTGASMERMRSALGSNTIGVVIFARGPCPDWITPIFSAGEDAALRDARAKIEELAQILAIKSMEDTERIYIDNALPEGWLWTIRKFRNNPWSDCGYAEANSPHEEPVYKAYGHTPSEAFRDLVSQVRTDRSPKVKP